MKFLCLLLLCAISASFAHTVRTKDDLASFRQECSAENNVTTDELEKIKKGELTDDEKTRCYVRCVGKKFDMFEDDKGLDVSIYFYIKVIEKVLLRYYSSLGRSILSSTRECQQRSYHRCPP